MPQLDAATYLSQIVWLGITFGGYYLLTLGTVLPSLSRRVKVRGKKVLAGKGSAAGAGTERGSVSGKLETGVAGTTKSATEVVGRGSQRGEGWRRREAGETDRAVLGNENGVYLGGLARVQGPRVARK